MQETTTRTQQRARLASLGLTLALLAACGGGGGGGGETPAPTPPTQPPATTLPGSVVITAVANAEPGQALAFGSDLASTAGLTLAWTFGDGGNGSGATPTHTYARSGRYEVRLTVSNSAGEQRVATAVATVVRCTTATAADGWCRQAPGYELPLINDVRFVDARIGYAAGELGTVLKTEDGGQTWRAVDLPQPQGLRQLQAADANRLWGLALDRRTLWTSADGGANWASNTAAPAGTIERIDVSRQGWLLARYGLGLPIWAARQGAISTDNGQTWRLIEQVTHFEADGTLWACQGEPVTCRWRSRDAGVSFVADAGFAADPAVAVGQGFGADGYAWQYLGTGVAALRPGFSQAWETWTLGALTTSNALSDLYADTQGGWMRTATWAPGALLPTYRFQWRAAARSGPWAAVSTPAGSSAGTATLDSSTLPTATSPDNGFVDGRTLFLRMVDSSGGTLSTDGGQQWRSIAPLAAETQRQRALAAAADDAFGSENLQAPARLERDAAGGLLLTLSRARDSTLDEVQPRTQHRSADNGAGWQPLLGTAAPDYTIKQIVMPDGQRGLATTDTADTWLQTDNGGRSWLPGPALPHNGVVSQLHFISDTQGFALQDGRLILTANGGRSWQAAPSATADQGRMRFVQFLDINTAFASFEVAGSCYLPSGPFSPAPPPTLGQCVRLFKTSNAGASWVAVGSMWAERPGTALQFIFTSPTQGVWGGPESLQRTVDGGVSWLAVDGAPGDFSGAKLRRPRGGTTLWAMEGNAPWAIKSRRLARSTDGGLSWAGINPPANLRYQPDPSVGSPYYWRDYWATPLRDIQFIDANNGWLVGDDGLLVHLLVNADGSVTPSSQPVGMGLSWHTVAAVPGQGVWIGGERGSILRRAATP